MVRSVGIAVTLTAIWASIPVEARTVHGSHNRTYAALRTGASGHYHRYTSLRSWASSGLQCVPFARENTGIELSGNAGTWWDKADGLYARGAHPEVGSILNFRPTGRMRMGHVAVVTNVVDGRHLQIDHANWSGRGRISRDIDVVDVSPANDWTAVRVELDHSNEFGSIYPTYGFIYDRPDGGIMVANKGFTPAPMLNAAPADLRPAAERMAAPAAATAPEEVAEADDGDGVAAPRSFRRSYRSHTAYRHGSARVRSEAALPTPPVAPRAVSYHGSRAEPAHRRHRS